MQYNDLRGWLDFCIVMVMNRFSIPSPIGGYIVRTLAAVGLAAGMLAVGARGADAAAITLGTAANYGVLVGTHETLTLNGGFNLSGNIGVSSGDTVTLAGNNAIGGTAYEDSSVTTNYSGNTSVSGRRGHPVDDVDRVGGQPAHRQAPGLSPPHPA